MSLTLAIELAKLVLGVLVGTYFGYHLIKRDVKREVRKSLKELLEDDGLKKRLEELLSIAADAFSRKLKPALLETIDEVKKKLIPFSGTTLEAKVTIPRIKELLGSKENTSSGK